MIPRELGDLFFRLPINGHQELHACKHRTLPDSFRQNREPPERQEVLHTIHCLYTGMYWVVGFHAFECSFVGNSVSLA